MFYNDPAHHKPFEIFRQNMFWTWPKRIMWTVASTLNRTKNYCFRLLSLIAENNATQNLEYQTNSQPTRNKNELVSTVILKKAGLKSGIHGPKRWSSRTNRSLAVGGSLAQKLAFCYFGWSRLNWRVENIFLVWRRWFAKRPIGEFKREKMEKANPTRYFKFSARWDWISDIEHFTATRNRFTYRFTGLLLWLSRFVSVIALKNWNTCRCKTVFSHWSVSRRVSKSTASNTHLPAVKWN